MDYQNFKLRNYKNSDKMTMFEKAMHGPIKPKKPKIQANQNRTAINYNSEFKFKEFESMKTKQTPKFTQNINRRKSGNAQSIQRSKIGMHSIVDAKIRKNLSIGDIKYEPAQNYTTTTLNKYTPKHLMAKPILDRRRMPSSVKNSSKPSTAVSSIMNYSSNINRKFANGQNLNKSVESGSKRSGNITSSNKSSAQKNALNIQEYKQPTTSTKNGGNAKVVGNTSNSGLDIKYFQSSFGNPNVEQSEAKWDEGQGGDEFENLTSDSMSSLASVPDEYTFVEQNNSNLNSQRTSSIHHKSGAGSKHFVQESIPTSQKTKLIVSEKKYKMPKEDHDYSQKPENNIIDDKEDDGNFMTDMENDETHTSGMENKYNLNVPSMITHLKRKDTYMESLDMFLNENLKGIADLIKIKKEVYTDLKNWKNMITQEKEDIQLQKQKGKDLEKDISRTLEENYCVRYQNEESYKVVQRVRNLIRQKYTTFEKEIDNLCSLKENLKAKVKAKIKDDSNKNKKIVEYTHASGVVPTSTITGKLTSNEYQADWLKKIVDNENNRVGNRLEMVREKSKILSQLVNYEDFEDTENSTIQRGIWNLLNN